MPYIPTKKQIEAHCAAERFVGYGGAMGGGKTRWLCEMARLLSIQCPGNFGVVARQSGVVLKMTTQEVFFTETLIPGSSEWQELGCKFNKSEGMLYFTALNPPSKIWFTGLDTDNTERIKSLNLGFFAIDEATEVSEDIFLMLCTRLRRKGIPKIYRKGLISANPEAGWVKRRFVDKKLQDYKFVDANYQDNPHLPDDYHELFAEMPIRWKEKYLEGNWGAVTGLVWKEFNDGFHIIPFQRIPPEWRGFRGFDHGQQNPAAMLWCAYGYYDEIETRQLLGDRIDAMNPEYKDYPIIIVHHCYYKPGLVSEHRKNIARQKVCIDKPGLIHADPSIWAKDREKIISDGKSKPYSIAEEYLESPYPLKGLVRGNNKVNVGLIRVSTLLNIGHLFFMDHESLDPLIGDGGEIRTYSWREPKNMEDDWPEEPEKRRDHACDALRYACMSMPPLSVEKKKIVPYNSFMAARQRAIAARKKGILSVSKRGKLMRL